MRLVFLLLAFLATCSVAAKSPDCSGPDSWAANSAFGLLKNAGLTDNNKVDFTKTKVKLLASERIGKDLFRQIHQIIFAEKSGNTIEVITSNNASSEECSMSGVELFVVSKHLGAGA